MNRGTMYDDADLIDGNTVSQRERNFPRFGTTVAARRICHFARAAALCPEGEIGRRYQDVRC